MTEQQLKRLRSEFPILATRVGQESLVYLDNAATTQKPRTVIDSQSNYYRRQNANVHRAAHVLAAEATSAYEAARQKIARWLNVPANTLIWTRGATESINLVAQAWLQPRLKIDDRILLLVSNHHANILPWQQIARRCGAHLDVVALLPDGNLDMEQYRSLLARQPKMVALSHVSNALGTVYPVKEMIAQAQAAGAWTLVDGAQALPHFDIDLAELNCDFYLFSGHKTFAPTGIGVLYGRYELLEQMQPWQTGGEMIEHVSFNETRFAAPPLRFEAGTPNIAGAIGLGAAIDYLSSIDRVAFESHEQRLLALCVDGLKSIADVSLLPSGQQQVALTSCTFKQLQVNDVATYLDSRGIAVRAGHHCAQPLMQALGIDSSLRISLAFYNTQAEVERLLEALDQFCSNTQVTVRGSQAELLEQVYSANDWQSRFSALMGLASKLKADPGLQQEQFEVQGCATRTWMDLQLSDSGRLQLRTEAQSRVMKGLLYLIADRVNGRKPSEIEPARIKQELIDLGFASQLTQTRGNALMTLFNHLERLLPKG